MTVDRKRLREQQLDELAEYLRSWADADARLFAHQHKGKMRGWLDALEQVTADARRWRFVWPKGDPHSAAPAEAPLDADARDDILMAAQFAAPAEAPQGDDLVARLRDWLKQPSFVKQPDKWEAWNEAVEDMRDAAARIESDAARIRALEADARRIDFLEAGIRDGSYLSIFNDIIAACRHAYAIVGPGPALRTVIDGVIASLAAPDSAASEDGR